MQRPQGKSAPSQAVSTTTSPEIPPSLRTCLSLLRISLIRRSAFRSAATPSRPSKPSTKRIRASFRSGEASRYRRTFDIGENYGAKVDVLTRLQPSTYNLAALGTRPRLLRLHGRNLSNIF